MKLTDWATATSRSARRKLRFIAVILFITRKIWRIITQTNIKTQYKLINKAGKLLKNSSRDGLLLVSAKKSDNQIGPTKRRRKGKGKAPNMKGK